MTLWRSLEQLVFIALALGDSGMFERVNVYRLATD